MYEGNIKCGAEYELHSTKIPMRDKDSESCDFCRTSLKSWNGRKMYSTKLITIGNLD